MVTRTRHGVTEFSGGSVSCSLAAIVLLASLASADTVLMRGAQSLRNVTITNFDQGKLEVLDHKTAKRQALEYADVAVIRLDKRPELNEAEKLLMLKEFDRAVDAYRTALARSGAGWEKRWIRVRLLNLLAGRGQVVAMADVFIDLSTETPDWLLAVSPPRDQIALADATARRDAGASLIRARDRATDPKVRATINRFLERLGFAPTTQPAGPAPIGDEELMASRRPGAWLDAWAEKQLAQDAAPAVLERTEKLLAAAARADLPALLYWRGRALLAANKFDEAALDLLRLAIEFPRASYAPHALHYASDALARAGRADYARAVREELIASYGESGDPVVGQEVDEARERIQGSNAE